VCSYLVVSARAAGKPAPRDGGASDAVRRRWMTSVQRWTAPDLGLARPNQSVAKRSLLGSGLTGAEVYSAVVGLLAKCQSFLN
jgi:hypothetical protein